MKASGNEMPSSPRAYYHSIGVIKFFAMIAARKFGKIVIGLVLLGLVKVATAFTAAPESVLVPVSQDNVQRLEITVDSYSFTPSRLVVKQNVPVELIFKSVSWIVPHNFVLKSPEARLTIDQEIGTGETTILRFTPTRIGEFKFSCTKKLLFFPSHEDLGMVGTLVVGQ
jgi:plastocyanin domain-containing protein